MELKYAGMEAKLVDMRSKAKSELTAYLDDEIGSKLDKLSRQLAKVDVRIFTYHEVSNQKIDSGIVTRSDIVTRYSNRYIVIYNNQWYIVTRSSICDSAAHHQIFLIRFNIYPFKIRLIDNQSTLFALALFIKETTKQPSRLTKIKILPSKFNLISEKSHQILGNVCVQYRFSMSTDVVLNR